MSANPIRVFITGATGFVGGALARALAQRGADVHALIRPSADRKHCDALPVTWHEGDITSPKTLVPLCKGATWIIHSAGRLGQAGVPEQVYRQINVEGTRNLMEAALAAGNGARVLHVSSTGVLGGTTPEPAREDLPYAPGNAYERSKAAAEQVAREYAERGLPVILGRPGFLYGPGDHHVLKLFQAVRRGQFFYIAGGRRVCHPTFIADAVEGLLLCLSRGRPGQAYHLTGPRPVTFRELGETIATALQVKSPWLDVPCWTAEMGAMGLEALARLLRRTPPLSRTGVSFFNADRVFSWEKAHQELGYTPRSDLAAGIAETVRWYRQHGWV